VNLSIYAPTAFGPLVMKPEFINADYVMLSLSIESVDEKDAPQPYVEDGAVYVPVRAWELMQEAAA
jgi:hypothetical protein